MHSLLIVYRKDCHVSVAASHCVALYRRHRDRNLGCISAELRHFGFDHEGKSTVDMDFMRQILVYVFSAILVPVVRIARSLILLVLPMHLIGKRSGIVTQAVLSLLLNFSLVYFVALFSRLLGVEKNLYMLIPAAFFTMLKSGTQRRRFQTGTSLEESLHKRIVNIQGGHPGSDYRKLLILREYVNEIAALAGLLAGGLLFLTSILQKSGS